MSGMFGKLNGKLKAKLEDIKHAQNGMFLDVRLAVHLIYSLPADRPRYVLFILAWIFVLFFAS